jgi:hypothetical protein
LRARGLKQRPDGAWILLLKAGTVEGYPRRDEGVVSFEFKVPLSDKTELVEEMVVWIVEIAAELKLKPVDPQLGNTVTLASSGVSEEFMRMARYAGEYLGVSEALGATTIGQPFDEGMSASAKVVFGLGGVLLLIYLAWDLFSRM